ncbi:MAG: voltage-gated chloride channel family protein [Bacteroidales bacterium]|nr:voltage-gated chloride channel family protein [Bacteroidales bacterium]
MFSNIQFKITFVFLLKWIILVTPISIVVGSLVALFLYLLDSATHLRWANEWIFFLLPLSGIFIVWIYKKYGKTSEKGNNLIIEEIESPKAGIPIIMAPLVLITSVLTHLFGGSAGREGTAVQIGGSLAHFFGKIYKISKADANILLLSGIAAGFGAIFGTPIAGAVFAIEVVAIGALSFRAIYPCLVAAIIADVSCTLWGIKHTKYIINYTSVTDSSGFHIDYTIVLWVLFAGVLFGLSSFLFSNLTRFLKVIANKYITRWYLIPFFGGLAIIALTYLLGTKDYLGIGVYTETGLGNSIINTFTNQNIDTFSWLWKIIFTAITLSVGFKGGEVTPLFFIGACLGNVIAQYTGMPTDLFAALGFVAVFGAASNTPLACMIMGVELFGGEHIVYLAIACFVAYLFSGNKGIYTSQKILFSKPGNK